MPAAAFVSPNFTDLFSTLETAESGRLTAFQEYNKASSKKTAALNALNAAQKALDDAFVAVRKHSASDSDWARATWNPPLMVAVE